MSPIIIELGTLEFLGLEIPLRVFGYGLMLVCGFLLAVAVCRWRAKRVGEDPETMTQIGIVALVSGIIGARIAHVIKYWRDFAESDELLWDVMNISSGGLIYYGGLILGTFAVIATVLIKRRPVRRYIDIVAVSLMIGLAFGRAGCFLNGCCWGSRCDADWALATRFPMYAKPLIKAGGGDNPFSEFTQSPSPAYSHQLEKNREELAVPASLTREDGRLIPPREFTPQQVRAAEAAHTLPLKPAQLLGIANALVLATVLTLFFRLRWREGQVFALLLMLYPITRFLLESIRADNEHNVAQFILTHNQITSSITFLAGLALMILLQRLPASAGPTLAEAVASRDNHTRRATGNRNA